MYRDYDKEEQTIKDLQELIAGAKEFENTMTLYCELMKEMFLSGSGKN